MASPSVATDSSSDSKLEIWKDAIYEQCQNRGDETKLFTQADILDFNVIPNRDVGTLLRVVQALCDDKLLNPVSHVGGLAWRWKSAEEAEKYVIFTSNALSRCQYCRLEYWWRTH
jgi:DNA-directed RNA polymerase III subunit RPC6